MSENKTIRDTDQEALTMAGDLIVNAMYGSLALHDQASEYPHISRIQLSTDVDGTIITLISTLSAHTKCIAANPKCALLVGEPAKGDPLAHPRISVPVFATQIEHGSSDYQRIRASHLKHYPKAALYVDFGDFSFFKLKPQSAALNGGFGKAYELSKDEVVEAIIVAKTEGDNDE
ncbi:MAG: pyridoxamine 5'-phosphate oxidase family protein [Pseudomonadota bacterium]